MRERPPRGLSTERALFALAVAAHLALLYWPRAPAAGGLPHVDKLAHLLVFAAVAWTGRRAALLPIRWVAGLLVVHAVVSEIVQHLVLASRSGDPADVLADVIGVAVGTVGGAWRHERAGDGRWPRGAAAGRDAGTG